MQASPCGQPATSEAAKALLWAGGVATTLIGSWITSRIRLYQDHKNAHHQELKERILAPVKSGLLEHFGPMAAGQSGVLGLEYGTQQINENAKITEDATRSGFFLVAPFPTSAIFGSLDSALLVDARRTHYRDVMERVDEFLSAWSSTAGECHGWCSKVADKILRESRMPAFLNSDPQTRSYVMHLHLALVVYRRLFGFQSGAARVVNQGAEWVMHIEDRAAALGSKEQIDAVIETIDQLVQSEAAIARSLRERIAALNRKLMVDVIGALDYAAASRRLHRRCDLVPFF
jgi:hypothetical protein